MKQTAVEWLVNQYIEKLTITPAMVEQAKAMEKEQIKEAYNQSWHDRMNPYKTAEKYYNETFKSE